jgi:hypothetical protein
VLQQPNTESCQQPHKPAAGPKIQEGVSLDSWTPPLDTEQKAHAQSSDLWKPGAGWDASRCCSEPQNLWPSLHSIRNQGETAILRGRTPCPGAKGWEGHTSHSHLKSMAKLFLVCTTPGSCLLLWDLGVYKKTSPVEGAEQQSQ